MEKKLSEARKYLNKIIKETKRNDLDWTIQFSISSIHPEKFNYCAQIEAPANGLQPLTWVYDSWEEFIEGLKQSSKGIDEEAIEKAWHQSELQRAEALMNYHKEAIEKMESSEKVEE